MKSFNFFPTSMVSLLLSLNKNLGLNYWYIIIRLKTNLNVVEHLNQCTTYYSLWYQIKIATNADCFLDKFLFTLSDLTFRNFSKFFFDHDLFIYCGV